MCALSQARPQDAKLNECGRASGWSPKISVLVLNDARNVHRIGTITVTAQIIRATWDSPLKTLRGWLGRRVRVGATLMGGPAGAVVTVTAMSVLDPLAPGDSQGQHGKREGQEEQGHTHCRRVAELAESERVLVDLQR